MEKDFQDVPEGACGPEPMQDPRCYEVRTKHAVFANTVEIHHHHTDSEQQPERGDLSKNDWLALLLVEILSKEDEKGQPMYTLEQELCSRLRKVIGKPIPTFKDYYGSIFRSFVERNHSRFDLKMVDSCYWVSIKKSKRNKKKKRKNTEQKPAELTTSGIYAEENKAGTETEFNKPAPEDYPATNEGEWQTMARKTKTPVDLKEYVTLPAKPTSVSPPPSEKRIAELDQALMNKLLSQKTGDTLLVHKSVDNYKKDRVQFTLDVVSMWNVPHRDSSYIVFGVKRKTKLPHSVIGLQSSHSEEFVKGLFHWHVFSQLPPKFSYREIVDVSRRVGVIEIERNYGQGFPSVVINDDLAPRLQKNQLWVRKIDQNSVVEASDLSIGLIYRWFQAAPQKTEMIKANAQVETKTEKKDNCKPNISPTTLEELECRDTPFQGCTQILTALQNFKKGHFVLLCGSLNTQCRNIEALAQAPWLAVYDFDFNGRESGLLVMLEDNIKKRRSMSVLTWCDPYIGLTELGTQWWSLRGRREMPGSKTSDTSHNEWYTKVLDKVDKLCIELARFSEDYTVLTFLVLWPCSDIEARCIQKFLSKARERVQPKLILCSTDHEVDLTQSKVAQMIKYEYEDKVQMFQTSLQELCSEIERHLQGGKRSDHVLFELPGDEKSKTELSDKDAAWLAPDLDVLYKKNTFAKKPQTTGELQAEADNFFRGSTIRWNTWYDVGAGFLDVERSISKQMTEHIREHFIKHYKSGTVCLYHAPGSGGTTMAQRVLWDLHTEVPCVKVKQRSGSSPEELADKLIFLHQRSRLPVAALFDGEDEPRLKQVLIHLQRSSVIVLNVKRYPYRLEQSKESQAENKFFLAGFVTKQESRNLVLRYTTRCQHDQNKVEKLVKLDKHVANNEHHQMFEYGMTVYAHEFQGVRAYVRGYLGLHADARTPLEPWQKCLGYIALVYFYGQTSIPCQFFVKIMGKSRNYVMNLEDFPEQFQIFVVEDSNEGRRGYLRISHYIIAGEILEQILNRRSGDKNTRKHSSPSIKEGRLGGLSTASMRSLKDFCVDFIKDVAKKRSKVSVTSQAVTYILTKTFIFRDNEEISDNSTPDTMTKRKSFSQIMIDLDSSPPYHGRLEVLQRLCSIFPEDPNFRAHMGRFYSICRPEEEQEAEKHFQMALQLCEPLRGGKDIEEVDDRTKQTLTHVYHMFGITFQRRIVKYTGRNPGDDPSVSVGTNERDIMEKLEEVIYNAKTACHYFLQARICTPQGQEDCFTYMNEIHVRLQACEFVNRVYPEQLQAFLSRKAIDHKVEFIRDSIPIIEDLIMECYNVTLLDRGSFQLQKHVRWFYSLFHECTEALQKFIQGEDLTSLRLSISSKKLKFRGPDSIIAVENVDVPEKEIESIISLLESIFRYQQASHDMPKRMLDLHYKDWILAIRNPRFMKVYTLEHVLQHVRQWHEAVHSPLSTFYLFVILSLLGFSTANRRGSTDCLVEAEMMLQGEAFPKLIKTVFRPRFPREWLGRDSAEGIRRLVTSSSVGHVEDRGIKNGSSRAKLAVCKGTIRAKNKKLAGYIDLDLGDNSTPVKVFYIPLLADLEGSRYEGERVQFHVAFTLEKGYEAYEVKLLKRVPCTNCALKVEMTWDQREVVCKCGSIIYDDTGTQLQPVNSPRTASFDSSV